MVERVTSPVHIVLSGSLLLYLTAMDVGFEDAKPVFFPYTPSKEAGWAFAVLFGLATGTHTAYMFSMRAWYFTPLIIGGMCELLLNFKMVILS